tara:strand:+ start:634 stop:834 length:201 start_codon:yes stop_codon:yes gene_type:complete
LVADHLSRHVSKGISLEGKLLQTTVKSTFSIAKIGWDHDHNFNELITASIVHFQTAIPQTQHAAAG